MTSPTDPFPSPGPVPDPAPVPTPGPDPLPPSPLPPSPDPTPEPVLSSEVRSRPALRWRRLGPLRLLFARREAARGLAELDSWLRGQR
jgi:hypothetical protein